MKLLSPPRLSPEEKCPYLTDRWARHEFFLATDVDEDELDSLLSQGFRKFGIYFFKPNCQACLKCEPLRVPVHNFQLSKGQKRVLKKNQDIKVVFNRPTFREEIYQLFVKHSFLRFGEREKSSGREDFISTHFTPSVPTMLSEFYLENQLIAVGFLDLSKMATSSVYFIYDPDFQKRSLGVLGALAEIEYTKNSGRDYYYLGYYIEENNSMNYKNQFRPYQTFNWKTGLWE